jgi:hypothetical protein
VKRPSRTDESPSSFQRCAVAHLPSFLHPGFCGNSKVGHKPDLRHVIDSCRSGYTLRGVSSNKLILVEYIHAVVMA